MLRVILDANIYISALLKPKGAQAKLVRSGFKGAYQIILSESIFKEICRVVRTKKIADRIPYTQKQVKMFLERLIDVSSWTADEINVSICEDPNDDIYLGCAKESQADFLVSGDKHLLKMKHFGTTQIVTTKWFLGYLRK